MDAYMQQMARRESQRHQQRDDDEEDRSQPRLVNETGYDRRKVVSVFKSDGRKGHHMQVGYYC